MKEKVLKKMFFLVFVMFFSILIGIGNCFSASIDSETLDIIKENAKNIDVNNISEEDILKIYDDLSENYTAEDIAEIVEQNRDEIEKQGVSSEIIDAGTEILKTTDTETIREIIKNDIDISDIQEKIEKGYSADEILQSVIEEIPTAQKVNIVTKLVFANTIIQTILVVIVILIIYNTILRAIIYKKAGKHFWAAFIPIYRDIVMYKICDISPWIMILWFIPVIGWIILFGASIVRKICLAVNFGRGPLFAFGNVLFSIFFESIIAFNPNIKYEK